MSWNGTCQIAAGSTIEEASFSLTQMPIHGGGEAPEETRKAVALAVDVVGQLIYSSALGTTPGVDGGNGFYVNIAGHANPENRARPGWSTDMITITVRQVPPDAAG